MCPPSLQKLSRAMFPASPPGGQELAGVPMSIPDPVFDSAPEPNSGQNLPEVKLIQDKPQGGRIYTPLPRMCVGMGLAVLCALFQRAGGVSKGGVLLVSIIGTCYWVFCIHRIHTVLSAYS